MFHRIETVQPLDDMKLLITFKEGTQRLYDTKPLTTKWPPFKVLEQSTLFRCVQVDPGGFGVIWNDELDLSCDELWENGTSW